LTHYPIVYPVDYLLGASNRGFAPLFNISLFFEEEKDQRRVKERRSLSYIISPPSPY